MNQKILGLDLSDQEIRYVLVERIDKTLLIKKAGKELCQLKSVDSDLYAQTLNRIIDEESLKCDRIYVTISSAQVILHQVVLPKMKKSELTEVITGEIEKLPVSSNSSYDYNLKSYSVGTDRDRIIFCAAEQEFINNVLTQVYKICPYYCVSIL